MCSKIETDKDIEMVYRRLLLLVVSMRRQSANQHQQANQHQKKVFKKIVPILNILRLCLQKQINLIRQFHSRIENQIILNSFVNRQ